MNNESDRNLTELENLFLSKFSQFFSAFSSIKPNNNSEYFEITIKNNNTENDLVIWIEKDEIGVGIGKWTHTHFNDIDECLLFIKDIIDDFIVVWKVTKPDGGWYSGHYDIRLWQENADRNDWNYNLIDEPDSNLDPNYKVQRSTFTKILEGS